VSSNAVESLAHESARDVHPLVEPAPRPVDHEYGRSISHLGHLDRPVGGRHHTASREVAGIRGQQTRPPGHESS
jgi:hypothetical protein